MLNSKKIAYITVSDPNNKHSWSGTNYYILQALKSKFETVDALGPDEPKFITFCCKVIHGLSLILTKKRFDYRHSTIYSKACGYLFLKKINKGQYDLIVAPAGIAYIANLKTNIPIVFIGDRIIANSINYHTIISNLWKCSEKQSINTEKLALNKASLNILSSSWAANFAEKYYKIPAKKMLVLPFGANMDVLPSADYVFKNKNKDNTVCKLLLIGTMWKNKGADIAINTLKILHQKGINATLTIVGCEPENTLDYKDITIISFLNKNTDDGLRKLESLFLSHTFFILPTRFDCTPIVFCEASAYALPILSANTGGVGGHIKEGVNGFLISHEDQGEGYTNKIIELFKDKSTYNQLCLSTRKHYDDYLNWQSWVNSFEKATKFI